MSVSAWTGAPAAFRYRSAGEDGVVIAYASRSPLAIDHVPMLARSPAPGTSNSGVPPVTGAR